MLKRTPDSKPEPQDGKRRGRSWKEVRRALLCTLAVVAALPVASLGQAPTPNLGGINQTPVYGGSVQTPLLFAGEEVPVNQLTLSLGAATFYDDNVFATNARRLSDEAVSFDGNLGITRQTDRMTANFSYTPVFLLYRQYNELDRVNHYANFNIEYRAASKIIFGLHENASYQNGEGYVIPAEVPLTVGATSPVNINQNILTYTARALSDTSGADLTYVKSRHFSVTLAGGYNLLNFGSGNGVNVPLYDINGFNASLTFKYDLSPHTVFGLLLLHQDSWYKGGQVFGYRQRSQTESSFLSLGSHITPSVAVTVFGGPQYITTVGQTASSGTVAAHFQASGGGSVTKEVHKTALNLMVQRSVTASGGLYTSEVATYVAFGARRRLYGRWEGDCHIGAQRADASLFRLANGRTDDVIAGVTVSRPLAHGSVFHVSYSTWHQLSSGTLPVFVNLDRNQFEAGFDYRFKALPLGR